jgi:hypothetical protein
LLLSMAESPKDGDPEAEQLLQEQAKLNVIVVETVQVWSMQFVVPHTNAQFVTLAVMFIVRGKQDGSEGGMIV